MKIKVDGDDNELHLQVNGDIYKEHAECLCDMAFGHAQRGVKKLIFKFANHVISIAKDINIFVK